VIVRAIAGLVLACIIAIFAMRARALTRSGMIAAIILGTITVAAGWAWGALLFTFFFSGTGWSRFQAESKLSHTIARVAKGGARDAMQVTANGALFGMAALLSLTSPWEGWLAIGIGALAAATADTWATELGMLDWGGPPRLITNWRRVPVGTSGAVSRRGLLAALSGAVFIALLAAAFRWPPWVVIGGAVGGIVGSLGDSVIGALWQQQRWCPRCGTGTERAVHRCGTHTEHLRGIPWLDNDVVNFLCTVIGAITALLFVLW
jgi:uncharacterized protein (TIGR00297 family)